MGRRRRQVRLRPNLDLPRDPADAVDVGSHGPDGSPGDLEPAAPAGPGGALSQLMPLITAAGATVQATTISGLYEVQGPAATWTSSPQELSANPAVQYADPAQTVQDLHGAQRPGLHQRRRVAAQRHLGHQCPRGLERHHRLGSGDRRRHRHRHRLQPPRPVSTTSGSTRPRSPRPCCPT